MNFNYFNPVRIKTGEGCVRKNADEFLKLGNSCLIVTSGSAAKKSGALEDVTAALESRNISHILFDGIEQNPTIESCWEAGKIARENKLEFIIGIGGGSPLDASKATAVFAANKMPDMMDIYKMDWANPALPIAAVGTTAGTGSEVTCFSILTMPNGRKKSFGKEDTYPRIMFGDAKYTATLPLGFTISTALDAFAHVLEGYFNLVANDITDVYALSAAEILYPQLKLLNQAKNVGDITPDQREKLYYASVVAGFALSQCGTVYCHTLGYYLTENHHVPHGLACAAFLPDLIERGVKYAPDKAERFFNRVGATPKELCGLISSLTVLPGVKMSESEVQRVAKEGTSAKNFGKTLPNGFSETDAQELLRGLFGE